MTSNVLQLIQEGRLNPDLLAAVSDETQRVEEELRLQMSSQVELVESIGRHTLDAGGKRLRPAFVALAAKAVDRTFDADRAVRLGAVVEMIHMATLIHDDVIDNASTRRGRPTAGAEYGTTASILSGDVLLAKAMLLLAVDGDLDVIRCVSESVVELAEGEVREVEVRGQFDLSERDHLDIVGRKTAGFVAACCELGAILADASAEVRLALRTYGRHIGIAFQIADDVLDYRGQKAKTGKPIATDFREGQATLPLIFLRSELSEAEENIARRKFGGHVTDDEVRMIVDWMESRGAIDRSMAVAREHICKAYDALELLPETPARQLLETVAEYVLARER